MNKLILLLNVFKNFLIRLNIIIPHNPHLSFIRFLYGLMSLYLIVYLIISTLLTGWDINKVIGTSLFLLIFYGFYRLHILLPPNLGLKFQKMIQKLISTLSTYFKK